MKALSLSRPLSAVRRAFAALAVLLGSAAFIFGCSSGTEDLLGIALDPPSRKPIDTSIMGVNNFFIHPEFGSIPEQFADIQRNIRLRHVRVLFAWTDDVQPTPDSEPSYGLYDDIVAAIPPGVDVLVVLTHQPQWMADPSNWINGNPRQTWVERWLKPTIARYRGTPGIVGWEIFNEPDIVTVPADEALGLRDPANYMELLRFASPAISAGDPGKLRVIAATTSIQANFPNNLNYNIALRDQGAQSLVDRWNIHYYGEQFENVVRPSGLEDFLATLSIPVWCTESGKQGNEQLAYVETVWPFLREKAPNIERFYYYQYGDTLELLQNFGLRTTDPDFPVSDLYVFLRDR